MAVSVSMYQLERIMGREAGHMFVYGWGGKLWYVPKRPSRVMLHCLGEPGAWGLCKHCGGENVSIPSDLLQPPSLKSRIIPMLEEGLSHNEIAEALNCHWRHVALVKQAMNGGRLKARKRDRFAGVGRLPL